MSDFTHFADLIPRAVAKYKMTREARAARICARFRDLAPGLIGADAPIYIKPKCFKGGTLYVSVPDSVWAQRVYVHRHDLIMKLNLDLEKEWVSDVRTVVG